MEPTEPLPAPDPDPEITSIREALVLIAQQVAELSRRIEAYILRQQTPEG